MPKSRKKAIETENKLPATSKVAKPTNPAKPAQETKPARKVIIKKITDTPKASSPAPKAESPHSKQSLMLALLRRPTGATVEEMAKAMNWQHHSVQGTMSGVLKKRLGLTIISGREARGRVYRIAQSQP